MATTTIDLYNALVEAGVDKEKARVAAESVVSRDEAQHFATKADIGELKALIEQNKSEIQRFVFTALVTQAVFLIGMTITLIQILT